MGGWLSRCRRGSSSQDWPILSHPKRCQLVRSKSNCKVGRQFCTIRVGAAKNGRPEVVESIACGDFRYGMLVLELTDWPTNVQHGIALPDRASLQPSLGVALEVRCRLARTLTAHRDSQAAAAITWGGGRTDQPGWRRYRPSSAGAWQA